MRCSPPVRISRSASGSPASARASGKALLVDLPGAPMHRSSIAAQASELPGQYPSDRRSSWRPAGAARRCARVRSSARGDARLQTYRQGAALADEAHAHALGVQLGDLASSASTNSVMRPLTSSAGRRQFSLENANRVSASMPRCAALLDAHAHRGEAGLVAGDARQAARGRPAAVAVHGDRDVARLGVRWRASDLHDLFLLGGEQRRRCRRRACR